MHTEPVLVKLKDIMTKNPGKLIDYGWTDVAIANYLNSDTATVHRYRKIHTHIQYASMFIQDTQ